MNTTAIGTAHTPPDVPVAEEQWFCPSCGQEAKALIGRKRVVICRRCQWAFEVILAARLHTEEISDTWIASQLASYDAI